MSHLPAGFIVGVEYEAKQNAQSHLASFTL